MERAEVDRRLNEAELVGVIVNKDGPVGLCANLKQHQKGIAKGVEIGVAITSEWRALLGSSSILVEYHHSDDCVDVE